MLKYKEKNKLSDLGNDLLDSIIENIPFPVAIFSQMGVTKFINHRFIKLFGYEIKDIPTRVDWLEKAYPEENYRNNVVEEMNQWESSGKQSLYESKRHVVCKDGLGRELITFALYLPNGFFALFFSDITGIVQSHKSLKESEERFRTLYKSAPVAGFLWQWKNGDFELIDYTQSGYEMTKGKIADALGSMGSDWFHDAPHILEDIKRCFSEKSVVKNEYPYRLRTTGEEIYVVEYCAFLPTDMVSLFHIDITEHINIEKTLRKNKTRLDIETQRLEEANVAFKVLLSHRNEEKRRLQEDIMYSVSKIIRPFIVKLKDTDLEDNQIFLLNTIENNLDEITTSFAGNLSYRTASLTSTEMEVAVLIKDGNRIKEIADIMCISEDTVCFHRKNIRKKLGIKHKKINLHSFLQQVAKR
jgi:PAS domain S-box-containing protein